MFKFKTLAAAAALAFVAGASQAAVLLVDHFNDPNPAVTGGDTFGGGESLLFSTNLSDLPVNQIASHRNIYQDLFSDPFGNSTQVSVGQKGAPSFANSLNIDNGSGANSTVRIVWTIDSFTLPPGPSSLLFQVLFNDYGGATPTNFAFTFSGAGGSFAIPTYAPPEVPPSIGAQFLTLSGSQATAFSGGGTLELLLTGGAGWDLTVDSLNISIPEPMSLALVGVGLLGAGVASRRRKAA